MIFEKIGIFILFLGPLVFFHELGHFLFARLFGVRVETFSIGFGPKLLKYKKGDTTYAISLIPLGGYVKMFGDDPLKKDEVPEEERDKSFTHKSKWQRFWIVMGGPLANFILAFVIFFALLSVGEKLPEVRVGGISEESILYQQGLRPGDLLSKINGKEVTNPTDIILDDSDLVRSVTVKRLEEMKTFSFSMESEEFLKALMQVPPQYSLRLPLAVDKSGHFWGVSLDEKKVDWHISFEQISESAAGQKIFLFPLSKESKPFERKFVTSEGSLKSFRLENAGPFALAKKLRQLEMAPHDLAVKSVLMHSAADKAKLKGRDVLVKLNGKDIYNFEDLSKSLQATQDENVSFVYWRDGEVNEVVLQPKMMSENGKKSKKIGVYTSMMIQELKLVEGKPKSFPEAFVFSFKRTIDSVVKTFEGFAKLITAEVSVKTIGGPLAVGKIASDSFSMSISYFFQLMALISVNLGVINLFPIPVLDGGHILFIILETFNRGPLSQRKMEIAQQVGLSFLLILMVGALFNDFMRFF